MKSIEKIVFDIETGPLPEVKLKDLMPEFEPDARLTDPVKIGRDIERKKENWIEKAALSAGTGRVLVVGILDSDGLKFIEGDEKGMLERWWDFYESKLEEAHRMQSILHFIGHNIKEFDLPFLVRRSWINRIIPSDLKKGRYYHEHLIDTMESWQMGSSRSESGSCSLDILARVLEVGMKSGDGKDFSKLYAEDRKAALKYCENDLRITWGVAESMGIIPPKIIKSESIGTPKGKNAKEDF
jgi:hypothetical protein